MCDLMASASQHSFVSSVFPAARSARLALWLILDEERRRGSAHPSLAPRSHQNKLSVDSFTRSSPSQMTWWFTGETLAFFFSLWLNVNETVQGQTRLHQCLYESAVFKVRGGAPQGSPRHTLNSPGPDERRAAAPSWSETIPSLTLIDNLVNRINTNSIGVSCAV